MNEMDVKTLTDNQGLKVAVIGIGNGGSQVALAAAKKGIPCMVMNTSTKDLDDSVIGSTINAFRIGDGWGSGKIAPTPLSSSRAMAMRALKPSSTTPTSRRLLSRPMWCSSPTAAVAALALASVPSLLSIAIRLMLAKSSFPSAFCPRLLKA